MHRVSLWTIFSHYLRIGWQGWGGPVAQIDIIHEHAVVQRKWMDNQQFKEAYAICTMLPGPEAAELCMYIGTQLRGKLGGLVAGLGFMLPNFVLITCCAWLYFRYAVTSDVISLLLYGVKPTMIAIVAFSLYRLSKKFGIWQQRSLLIVALAMMGLSFMKWVDGVYVLLLLGAAYVGFVQWQKRQQAKKPGDSTLRSVNPWLWGSGAGLGLSQSMTWSLSSLFFKIGALSFGGAYTVLALLQFEAVDHYGWLTTAQYLDGLAINELIPGPLIMVAAFVGYAAQGWLGALLATCFIFLPAFVLVLFGMPYFNRMRNVQWLSTFLIGVSAAVVGLTANFLVRLSFDVFHDWMSPVLALVSLVLLVRWKLPIWLVFLIGVSVGTGYGFIGMA